MIKSYIKPKRVLYDSLGSCNKCGCLNKITKEVDYIANHLCEAETECTSCGFKDYWAYGFYESGADGYNASKKY